MSEPMTESQKRFQNELEGCSMPDELIRELARARACALTDIDGETKMIINREGMEIMMRYAPDHRRTEQFRSISARWDTDESKGTAVMGESRFDLMPELEGLRAKLDLAAERRLFESIAISGVLEAVKLAKVEGYTRPILIDGHKRYRITERLKLALPVDEKIPRFKSLNDMKRWLRSQPNI